VKVNLDHEVQSFAVDLTPGSKSYRSSIGENTVEPQILQAKDGLLDLPVDGRHVRICISSDNTEGQALLLPDTKKLDSGYNPRKTE
jgi:hypothetical protein